MTKLFLSQLRLLQFHPMKLHSLSLFKLSHIPLRNAPFHPRSFSVRPDRIRASKSLVDDEAELSNWVDDLRTGRAETLKPAQRVDSREPAVRDGGFRKSSVTRDGSSLRQRRGGGDFKKGKPNLNAKGRFGLSSDSDNDEVVERGKFKGGGGSGSIGEFLSEDDVDEEETSDEDIDDEDEEIVKKSRSVLFGKQNGVSTTTRPASSGGSDSYLSDSRCVCVFVFINQVFLFMGLAYLL